MNGFVLMELIWRQRDIQDYDCISTRILLNFQRNFSENCIQTEWIHNIENRMLSPHWTRHATCRLLLFTRKLKSKTNSAHQDYKHYLRSRPIPQMEISHSTRYEKGIRRNGFNDVLDGIW